MGNERSRQCLGSNRLGESEIRGTRLGPPEDGRPALVAAIDVGGTIVEAGGAKLTKQGEELAMELAEREARVVLYSFDDDARVAAPLLEALGVGTFPAESCYLIARHHSPEEVWAFPMSAGKRSKYVDWEADKPKFLENLETPSEIEAATEESLGSDPDVHRFTSQVDFRRFVDGMLERGHVIFRACHDPQHEYFRSRAGAADVRPRLKALAATARMVVAFDDSPADWEVLGGNGKVLRAVTPQTAAARKGGPLAADATNFVLELQRLEDDLAEAEAIARGERPKKKKGGSSRGRVGF